MKSQGIPDHVPDQSYFLETLQDSVERIVILKHQLEEAYETRNDAVLDCYDNDVSVAEIREVTNFTRQRLKQVRDEARYRRLLSQQEYIETEFMKTLTRKKA